MAISIADALFRGQRQGAELAQFRDTRQQNEAKRLQQEKITGLSGTVVSGQGQGQFDITPQAALGQVAAIDPQKAIRLQQFLAGKSKSEQVEIARENEVLTRGALDALSLPPERRRAFVEQKQQEFIAQGRDTSNTDQALAGTDEELDQFLNLQARGGQEVSELFKQQLGGATGQASAKTEILADGTTIQALPDGTVDVRNPAGNVVTGQDRLDVLKRSAQFGIETKEKLAEVAIGQARGVASATQREKRVSDIKTELSTRNRNAGRESVRLNQALKVASTATQGIVGASKLQLAKLFPDIDVGNEALLDQTLKQLAIDQLQNFKGPTTDFEFAQVEATTGAIGDPRTANIARLKSLQRANWFNRREFEQFNRHSKSGGDPDTFAFNFGEPMKTKKGVFTLQQVQDTAVSNNLSIEETLKRLNK